MIRIERDSLGQGCSCTGEVAGGAKCLAALHEVDKRGQQGGSLRQFLHLVILGRHGLCEGGSAAGGVEIALGNGCAGLGDGLLQQIYTPFFKCL